MSVGIFADLADSRSWVDPITNYASLSGVALRYDFRRLIQGEYPLTFLPTFLHELTHHWCFQSPVGMTVAMLKQITLRHALTRDTTTLDTQFDVLENLIRCDAATAVLRPLAEGLSLYAEFDIRPGGAKILSQPMQWVTLFGEGSITEKSTEQNLAKTLFEARLRNSVVDRKANVMLQPLGAHNGGYLPGYMFVKNLWLEMMERCTLFVDLDFFLSYLRSYFYEDFGMVAAILNPDTVEMATANEIIGHIQKRIRRLYETGDVAEHVHEYQKDVLDHPRIALFGGDTPPRARRGILLTEEEVSVGTNRYHTYCREIVNVTPNDVLSHKFADFHRAFIARRQILCIAREKVHVRLSKNRQHVLCEQDNSLLCAAPAVDFLQDFSGDGTIAYIVFPRTFESVVTVTFQGRVVAVSSVFELNPETRDLLLNYPTDEATFSLHVDVVDRLLTSVIQDGLESLWKHFITERDKAVNSLYEIGALIRVSNEQLEECVRAFSRQGFLDIFSGELDVVNAYALLGLCTSLKLINETDLREIFRDLKLDLGSLKKACESAENKYGVRLLKLVKHRSIMLSLF